MTATAQALVPVSPYVRHDGDTVELLQLAGEHVGLYLLDGAEITAPAEWDFPDDAPAHVVDAFLAWDTGDSWEAYEDVVDEYVTTAAKHIDARAYASEETFAYVDDATGHAYLVERDGMETLGRMLARGEPDAYSRWRADTTAREITAEDAARSVWRSDGDADFDGIRESAAAAGDLVTVAGLDLLSRDAIAEHLRVLDLRYGWYTWCALHRRESCRNDDQRRGFDFADEANDAGGNRPTKDEAKDLTATDL